MNPVKLHHEAEQRCKPLGCRVQGCMRESKDPDLCNKYLREFQACVNREKEKILGSNQSKKSESK